MSTTKKIKAILPRPVKPGMVGDGFRVFNYFPSGNNIRKEISPFLMLDFGPSFDFGPSDKPRGVDVHPHRGFETVTIAYKGAVEHHDSAGNSGIIYPGDVQWMTAASGILHKEFHETEFSKKGGPFEMIQLWVNLPKKDKMSTPKYQEISSKNKVLVSLEGNAGEVNVIAGDFKGTKGAASTFTPINLFSVKLNKDGKLQFDIPSGHNTAILVVEGSLQVNGTDAILHDFILFANEGETVDITASENAVFLVMSGEPIDEPIAQYGPFVMNTQQELMEAIDDFNNGKFGRLE
ncbi:MAG: pirin family protein [Bacteroidetes bacterium]|jgi:redox-sensitive bicupin YhaK (pirin superfamily)|nr:pirin family protein [Bacteroidota bacterium]